MGALTSICTTVYVHHSRLENITRKKKLPFDICWVSVCPTFHSFLHRTHSMPFTIVRCFRGISQPDDHFASHRKRNHLKSVAVWPRCSHIIVYLIVEPFFVVWLDLEAIGALRSCRFSLTMVHAHDNDESLWCRHDVFQITLCDYFIVVFVSVW